MEKCVLKITVFALLFVLVSCTKKEENVTESEQIGVQPNQQEDTEISTQIEKKETMLEYESAKEETNNPIIVYNNKKELPSFNEPDKSAEVFGSCFSKDLPAYKYIIRNPMIDKKIYIEQIDSAKNKILKIEHEDYYYRNGYQLWNGDGEDRVKSWKYYFFDSDGHISDYYYIIKTVDDKDRICDQNHVKYHWDGKFYYVYEHIIKSGYFGRDEIKETVYEISKKDDTVVLSQITDNYPKNNQYLFEKDLVTNLYGSDFRVKDVYKYLEKTIKYTHYIIRSEEKDKGFQEFFTMIYDRGLPVETYDSIPNVIRIQSYKMNGDEGTKYFYEEENNEIVYEITKGYILAKHNEAGFIEKLRIDPFEEKSSSEYVFEDSELLDTPDDILKKYFGFE